MGLFKDLKNMKDTVHAAPDMIRQGQALGAQAQQLAAAQAANPMVGAPGVVTAAELEPIAGVSLETYAQWAKTVGAKKLDQAGIEAFVQSQGFPATAWQEAYDGWNARMKNNMALSVQYGNLYQQAVSL